MRYPPQVMALIAYLMEKKGNFGPHLIIVPNAVMVNWKSELTQWLPTARCIYYVGSKEERARKYAAEVQPLQVGAPGNNSWAGWNIELPQGSAQGACATAAERGGTGAGGRVSWERSLARAGGLLQNAAQGPLESSAGCQPAAAPRRRSHGSVSFERLSRP